jgi:antirestriction protein ArdC
MKANDIRDEIVSKVVAALENGCAPWRKPWGMTGVGGAPRNAITGRRYTGVNVWLLALAGFESSEWCTFNQARKVGGHVRKGEKGTKIVFYSVIEKTGTDGKVDKIPLLRCFTVFNREQCEGLPAPKGAKKLFDGALAPLDAGEKVLAEMPNRPTFVNDKPSDRAYYSKTEDKVVVPCLKQYDNPVEYYLTAFHEMAHATGHSSRLNRDSLNAISAFGGHEYSKEELVAEMAASMVAAECGITTESITANSTAYLVSWANKLKAEPGLLISAASQAQKATDFILDRKEQEDNDEE